ncbi:hypothetical protein C4556_00085 [Candidatus Parcubacteria bacterium]|nr:MAG: hypothetical protein C4556_00085 [Candidatus Parcubacteria bacterium]
MLISELRASASRTAKMLEIHARKLWNDSLQIQIVDFIAGLNRAIGDKDDKEKEKFFFAAIRHENLKPYISRDPSARDTWKIVEDLCEEVTHMGNTLTRTPDRYKLTIAFCKALKETSHPMLRR